MNTLAADTLYTCTYTLYTCTYTHAREYVYAAIAQPQGDELFTARSKRFTIVTTTTLHRWGRCSRLIGATYRFSFSNTYD